MLYNSSNACIFYYELFNSCFNFYLKSEARKILYWKLSEFITLMEGNFLQLSTEIFISQKNKFSTTPAQFLTAIMLIAMPYLKHVFMVDNCFRVLQGFNKCSHLWICSAVLSFWFTRLLHRASCWKLLSLVAFVLYRTNFWSLQNKEH